MSTVEIGYLKGEPCNRENCAGVIDEYESELGCSCHISAPCGHCTEDRSYCPKCDWVGADELVAYEGAIHVTTEGIWAERKERVLDRTKIDYNRLSHTNSSMKVVGVFPKGATPEQVETEVKGTFGGRFKSWSETTREFTYIAYTD